MSEYIDANKFVQYLVSKKKTQRSTIEIQKLLDVIAMNTVKERVVVEYQSWIDVRDRLPDAGQYVLLRQTYHSIGEHAEYEEVTVGYLHRPEKGMPYFYYVAVSDYGDMVRASSICPGNEFVTHWIPMPIYNGTKLKNVNQIY